MINTSVACLCTRDPGLALPHFWNPSKTLVASQDTYYGVEGPRTEQILLPFRIGPNVSSLLRGCVEAYLISYPIETQTEFALYRPAFKAQTSGLPDKRRRSRGCSTKHDVDYPASGRGAMSASPTLMPELCSGRFQG